MMKYIFRISILILFIGCPYLFEAVTPAQRQLTIDFRETKLKNGLRVITVEDHTAPVVAIAITYNVGSRNEKKGRTGFAHLFEHMMFQGSGNVGKAEHFALINKVGGEMNGTTDADRTNYFEAVPANQLDLILFLEADRMRSLEITKENLDNQRNAVQEERRLRVDNQAYGKSDELLDQLIYENFAYQHPIVGSMEDLNAASVEDVAEFFKTYYAPNNAVLTLVGDFKTEEAIRKIKNYFEDIPNQPFPPTVEMTEPKQTAEKRTTIEDPLARLPRLNIAYKAVEGNTPDYYSLQVLASIFSNGQSSRLFQKLVKEMELAANVSGKMEERRGIGAFSLEITLRPGKSPLDAEKAIFEEIEKVKKEGLVEWELQKAKNNSRRSFINGLHSSLNRAIILGRYAIFYDDPNLINTRLGKINSVGNDDIKRVTQEFLTPENRVVILTTPLSRNKTSSVQINSNQNKETVK